MSPTSAPITPFWLLVALGCTACGGGLERVSFVSDLLTYSPGGRVGLSLVNTSSSALGINLCLSRLVKEDLVTYGPDDTGTCALEAKSVSPGETVEERKSLPELTPAGTWKYETTLRLPNGGGERVYTPAFTVNP